MFYDNIRAAYKAGKIEILENGHESVRVVAAGLAGLQSKFLTGAERQSLRDMLNDELLTLLKGTNQKCPECEGTGAIRFLGQEANTNDLVCPRCDGDGKVFVEDDE